jgi:hypothetical protein
MITISRVRELPADLSELVSASLAEGGARWKRLLGVCGLNRGGVIRLRSNTEQGDRFWRACGFTRLSPFDPDATHVLEIAQEGVTFN